MVKKEHRCSARVTGLGGRRQQCSRKGVRVLHGEFFCKQHDPTVVQARLDERTRLWKEKQRRAARPYEMLTYFRKVLREIAKGQSLEGHKAKRALRKFDLI